MKKQYAIIDIDGTIANLDHRLPYINKPRPNWEMFFLQCNNDKPIVEIVEIVKILNQKFDLIFITGRPEYVRFETEEWLSNQGITWEHLLMRQDNDKTEYTQFKLNALLSLNLKPTDIAFAIDDEPAMCDFWVANGITILKVTEKKITLGKQKFFNNFLNYKNEK